ncbi:MAG: lamin tail domain-containing protein [Spirochaetales bacterium]|nr:lamin tail domain-containing protein [Spirochaetales bacterium]
MNRLPKIVLCLALLLACQYQEDDTQNLAVLMLWGGPKSSSTSAGSTTTTSIPNECTDLCINEVYFATTLPNNDFVEIYNPSSSTVNLSSEGIYLHVDAACNGADQIIALSGSLAEKSYFVIAPSGHNLLKVNQIGLSNALADGHCFALARSSSAVAGPSDTTVLDWVTVGGAGTTENGVRATYPGNDQAAARFPNGTDTNRNNDDFRGQDPTIGSSNGARLTTVVINEVGSGAANNDFIELYNTGTAAVDLAASNAWIQRDDNCDMGSISGKHALVGTIPAGGYYVIARSGHALLNVNQADLGNIEEDYCIALTVGNSNITAPTDAHVIDWVTLGGSGTTENSSRAPSVGDSSGISRCTNGSDTNTNATDFRYAVKTPGATNDCTTQHIGNLSAGSVLISEVLYDPSGACSTTADEFVEIINTTGSAVHLEGATLRWINGAGTVALMHTFGAESLAANGRAVLVAGDSNCYTSASLSAVTAYFDTATWSLTNGGATVSLLKTDLTLPAQACGGALAPGATGPAVMDYVGWGTACVFQTAATTGCSDQPSVRSPATGNTGNNSTDFSCDAANPNGTPGQ